MVARYTIDIPEDRLTTISAKVAAFDWSVLPDAGGWSAGVGIEDLRRLVAYWRDPRPGFLAHAPLFRRKDLRCRPLERHAAGRPFRGLGRTGTDAGPPSKFCRDSRSRCGSSRRSHRASAELIADRRVAIASMQSCSCVWRSRQIVPN